MAGIAAVALATPGTAMAKASVKTRLAAGQPPTVIAHRARIGTAPANSLAGIRTAIDHGVEMVEVDVQVTRGGGHILMHDPTLSTSTNVKDVFPDGAPSLAADSPKARKHLVADYALADIARLRLRDREGGDHPVPTLDAALDLAEGELLVILDLKIWEHETLAPLLQRRSTDNLLLFTTGSEAKLHETAEATGIGVYLALEDFATVGRAFERAVARFGPGLKMISVVPGQFTDEIRAQGAEHDVRICVNGFALDDAMQLGRDSGPWLRALDLGADAYLTRLPTVVRELLQR